MISQASYWNKLLPVPHVCSWVSCKQGWSHSHAVIAYSPAHVGQDCAWSQQVNGWLRIYFIVCSKVQRLSYRKRTKTSGEVMYWHTQLPMRSLQNKLHGLHPTNKPNKQNKTDNSKTKLLWKSNRMWAKKQKLFESKTLFKNFLRVLINNWKKSLKDSCTHVSI